MFQYNTRAPRRLNVVRAAPSLDDGDDDYKTNDGVVYNAEYWKRVRALNQSWKLSSWVNDEKKNSIDYDLAEIIQKKWKKKYNCELYNDHNDCVQLAIMGTICEENEAEIHIYNENLKEISKKLTEWNCLKSVAQSIMSHPNQQGPSLGGFMFGKSGRLLINTGVCISKDRESEWNI